MKNRLILLWLLVYCAAAMTNVQAQPVTLVGLHSCSDYLHASEKDRIYPLVWTLGYLSGWTFTTRINALADLNHERVGEFLLDYCKANAANRTPATIANAADALRFILEKRAKGEPLLK